ncbi:hypothetical protein [Streptomyces hydrogenans]
MQPDMSQHPSLAISAASNPGTTPEMLNAMVQAAQLKQESDWFHSQASDLQRQWWNSQTEERKEFLTQAGFVPPEVPQAGEGDSLAPEWLTDVWEGVKDYGGGFLHALGSGYRNVTHIYRTMNLMIASDEAQQAAGLSDPNNRGIGDLASDWSTAWDATSNGEKFFLSDFDKTIGTTYADRPDELWSIKQAAMGTDPAAILTELYDKRGWDPARLQTWLESEEFNSAVTAANATKSSPGRDLARALGLGPETEEYRRFDQETGLDVTTQGVATGGAFKWVSGTGDFLTAWFADPLIIGGKATKAVNWWRYGFNANHTLDAASFANRLEKVTQTRGVRQFLLGVGARQGDEAAEGGTGFLSLVTTAREGSGLDRARALTELGGRYRDQRALTQAVLSADQAYKFRTIEDFNKWGRESMEALEIMRGRPGVGIPVMGSRNALQIATYGIRPGTLLRRRTAALEGRVWDEFTRRTNEDGLILSRPEWREKWDDALTEHRAFWTANAGRALADLDDAALAEAERLNAQLDYWGGQVAVDSGAMRSILAGEGDLAAAVRDPKIMEAYGAASREVYDGVRGFRFNQALRRGVLTSFSRTSVDIGSQKAVDMMGHVAASFLSPGQANLLKETFRAADIAGRKQMSKGIMLAAGRAAGMSGAAWDDWSQLVAKGIGDEGRAYGLTGTNKVGGREYGFRERDMSMQLDIPDFRMMWEMAQKSAVTRMAYGSGNAAWIDWTMQNIWRPSVLLRPALVLRNIVDEIMVWAVGRDDPFKNWLAGSLIRKEAIGRRREELAATGQTDEFMDMLGTTARVLGLPSRAANVLSQKVISRNIAPSANSVEKLMSRRFLSGSRLAAAERLTGVDRNTLSEMADAFRYNRDDLTAAYLTDLRGAGHYAYKDKDAMSSRKATRAGGHYMDLSAYLGKEYKRFGLAGPNAGSTWLANIVHEYDDAISRLAMQNVRDRDAAIRAISDYVERPDMDWYRASSVLYKERGSVGVGAVAYDEAFTLLGGRETGAISDDVLNRLFTEAPDGTLRLVEGNTLTRDVLDDIPTDKRPAELFGRDVLWFPQDEVSRWAAILDSGYRWVAESTAAITREPMYWSALVNARRNLRPFQERMAAALSGKAQAEIDELATRYLSGSALYDQAARRPVPMYETLDDDGHLFGQAFTTTPNRDGQAATAFLDIRNPVTAETRFTPSQAAEIWQQIFHRVDRAGRDVSRVGRREELTMVVPLSKNGKRIAWPDQPIPSERIKRRERGREAADGSFVMDGGKATHVRITYAGERVDDYGIPAVTEPGKRALEEAERVERAWRDLLVREAPQGRDIAAHLGRGGSVSVAQIEAAAARFLRDGEPEAWVKFWDRFDRAAQRRGFDGRHTGKEWTAYDGAQIRPPYVPGTGLEAEDWAQAAAARMYAETAHQHALEDVLNFVDNPEARSQFSTLTRNYMPFYRAQENALRRWSGALKSDFSRGFAGLRKLQLLVGGLQNTGFVQQLDDGRLVFAYPAAGEVNEFIANRLADIGLGGAQVLAPTGILGELRALNPILDPQQSLVPSMGPLIMLPLNLGSQWNEEIAAIRNTLVPAAYAAPAEGESALSTGVQSLLPTFLRRAIQAGIMGDTQQLNNSTINSMRALEVAGKGLPPDATPEMVEQYIDDVKMSTRNMMLVQAFYGLFMPTPPRPGSEGGRIATRDPRTGLLTGEESGHLSEVWEKAGYFTIDDQLRGLLRESDGDMDEAMVLWLAGRDDMRDAMLVLKEGNTKTPSKVSWSDTKEQGEWLSENSAWVRDNKTVAPYFIPMGTAGDRFDYRTRLKDMAYELRVRKSPEEALRSFRIAASQATYYESKETFDAALKDASPEQTQALQAGWSQWKEQFYALNPVFAQYQSEFAVRDAERKTIVDAMRKLVYSDSAPDVPVTATYRGLIQDYDGYQQALSMLAGDRSRAATQTRAAIRAGWSQHLQGLVDSTEDVAVSMFIDRVLRYVDD